ncbi:MAG: FAD-binding monooxygenase [Hyphomicrobiaceae bacterium]
MQFHLNGYRPGDPEISAPVEHRDGAGDNGGLPAQVDVLIVGCGPAGLTLAAQLAAFPSISTRIVDQKTGPLQRGQADGIACRTMEMFEAFGFAERVLKEAYWVNETVFWEPDPRQPEHIVRKRRIKDTEDGLSEFPHVILNQARVHDHLLNVMHNAPSRLVPDYGRRLVDLKIKPAHLADRHAPNEPVCPPPFAATAHLERTDPEHVGQFETVRARYVVGCDGARSTVRSAIGRQLRGDSANQAWGVMDILAITNFPDIRYKALIRSAHEGSALIIPREGGYLVRLYIELDQLNDNERVANRHLTPEHLIAAARRILKPFTLDVREIVWWSVYEIGQRLCDKFDDVPETDIRTRFPHVFIAGDACHTHSPKAGQGMNVSMRDSFNLGWKIASVLEGRTSAKILHTYSAERQTVARELIDFDREWAKMMAARPVTRDAAATEIVNPEEFQSYFIKHGRFTAGTAIQYYPSIICGQATYQHLAEGLLIGMRFHSAPVVRAADAKPLHLGHIIKADGRWRLLAFASAHDPYRSSVGIFSLCEFLSQAPSSPIRKYTPKEADIDAVIDVRVIFQQSHQELSFDRMPALLRPSKGRFGLCDYEKIFCSSSNEVEDIFEMRCIDRKSGCIVLVRPDQHVAHVLPLNAYSELAAFFDGFMIERD